MAAAASHYEPVTTILLSGSLAQRFGREHRRQLQTGQGRECFKALECTINGFRDEIIRLSKLGMRFAIFRNGKNVGGDLLDIGGTRELRIVPVIAGSKRAGILQTVLGIVLIVVGAYARSPNLIATGVAMTAGGVIQMLSPQASGLKQSASPENLPSYAFGSAKNTVASGNPVPICIGERRWGGAIISASILAEDKT
ncbi:tail assembly protein [Pseudomonas sp. Ps21-P2]|uniref:tail assembly protein n=1 Tax=Pseudomonas sp. Ps21-P2 TaxID=3080331 RepID=UPI0032078E3C